MHTLFGVFTSDKIALDGSVMLPSAMMSALVAMRGWGVPTSIGHDYHRPLGWSRPLGLYLEPGMTRLYGITDVAETEEESEKISRKIQHAIVSRHASIQADFLPEFQRLLGSKMLGTESFVYCNGAALMRPVLAVEMWPRIFAEPDKDGLYPLKGLAYKGDGVFQIGELLLYAHPYFRRSLSRLNTVNDELFRTLQAVQQHVEVRIALDPDMVGLASTFTQTMEHEYWWGPHFEDTLKDIDVGVSVHQASKLEHLFHGINRTEFRWQSRDEEHIFEAEELRDVPTFGRDGELYGCRYVHSIVDERTGTLMHLDGAVKEYDVESMLKRLGIDIGRSDRSEQYTKLWRLDGAIPITLWKALITHHFRDNHLVGEYLGGVEVNARVEAPHENEPARVRGESSSSAERILDRLVPVVPAKGSGPRINVSLVPALAEHAERIILSRETWNSGETSIEMAEIATIEIVKLLGRKKLSITRLPTMRYYAVGDLYTNFPLMYHGNVSLVGETADAFLQLLDVWIEKKQDREVNVNLAFEAGEYAIAISVLGHVADVRAAVAKIKEFSERLKDDKYEWLNEIGEFLKNSYPPADNVPPLEDLWTVNGRLGIRRTAIDRVKYQFMPRLQDTGLGYELRVPKEETEVADAMKSGKLAVVWAKFFDAACSRCGQSYLDCLCSVYFDKGVYKKWRSQKIFEAFWTEGILK